MFSDLVIFLRSLDPVFYLILAVLLPSFLFIFLCWPRKKKTALNKTEVTEVGSSSFMKSIAEGLGKTRSLISGGLDALFQSKTKLDGDLLESVYETLYKSDMGVKTTEKLVAHLKDKAAHEEICDSQFVKKCLSEKVFQILKDVKTNHTEEDQVAKPRVILVVGVNGAGKTTTIGKLASKFMEEGKSVSLCAGDTYRAAAIEQLQIWGERLKIKVFAQKEGSDPAAVAFDAVKAVKSRGTDILIVDTAGRLQNKKDLMEELAKIKRAIEKELPGAPHEVLMVLDSTMGQNALQQVSAFSEFVDLTGLIVTKLDGTAKGGVLVALADQYKIPVKFIGIGEAMCDLKTFEPREYAEGIFS